MEIENMSLRDYFAGQCCAAMISTITNEKDYKRFRNLAELQWLESVSSWIAQESYKQADAMLAQRSKK